MATRGITLADWSRNGYGDAEGLNSVVDVSRTGANSIAFVVTAYQGDSGSLEVRIDPQRTPSAQSVANAIVRAKSLSFPMAVTLKPHIDLDDGTWRGEISPADPSAWFDSYRVFLFEWVELAAAMNVEQFVIGTELAGTLEHESHWRELIRDVRRVYDGEITYAASWDEANLVPFWKELDIVGVNFYAPVSGRPETGRFDILVAWQPWIDRLRLLHKKADRDILITEIGYRSIDGAGMHPYDFNRQAAVDYDEQADLYWGTLEALGDRPWVRGVLWWNWLAKSSGNESADYTPKGKPAEKELVDAWIR
jgi:hypothetical protein